MNERFTYAIIFGDIELIRKLIVEGVDPSVYNDWAIKYAIKHRYVEVVELLLKDSRIDPSVSRNWIIRYVCENGYIRVVRLLLGDSRVDPSANDNYAIRSASYNEHIEIVELLLKDIRVLRMLKDDQIKMYHINRVLKDKFRVETDKELKNLISVI